jgi:hypothetical protein
MKLIKGCTKTHVTCSLMLAPSCFTFNLDVQNCYKINLSLYVQSLLLQFHMQSNCANKCIRKQPISMTLVYHTSYYNWKKGFINCFYNRPCHCRRNHVGQCLNLMTITHNNCLSIQQTSLKHWYLWCKSNFHKCYKFSIQSCVLPFLIAFP